MKRATFIISIVVALIVAILSIVLSVPKPSFPDNFSPNPAIGEVGKPLTPVVPPVTSLPGPVENPSGTTSGGCYIGGCSGQICSDQPDMVSTCEYRAEYACYQKAKCERQASGQCGWTETAEIKMCLNEAKSRGDEGVRNITF